jgi:hypothetical protein
MIHRYFYLTRRALHLYAAHTHCFVLGRILVCLFQCILNTGGFELHISKHFMCKNAAYRRRIVKKCELCSLEAN